MAAMTQCPICGADWRTGMTCEDAYHILIAREFVDPLAGMVHHLTVLCYMIQHDQYTQSAYDWARASLEKIILQNLTTDELRLSARSFARQKQTGIVRNPNTPSVVRPKTAWTMTVVDAAQATDSKEHVALVKSWARAVWDAIK